MSNCRLGHSDNQIGFGSGISDLRYFRYVKIGTDRVFIKLGSDSVRYLSDPDNFGYIRSNCRKIGSGLGLAVFIRTKPKWVFFTRLISCIFLLSYTFVHVHFDHIH